MFSRLVVCLCLSAMALTRLPIAYAAAKPIHFNCMSAQPDEVISVATLLKRTPASEIQDDPVAMMIAVALNQRYGRNFRMQDIQGLRENSLYELSFPFKSDLLEIRTIIENMGYHATGYRFNGAAIGVQQGDVGFLLDSHVHFDGRPVIALLLEANLNKRLVLYGDGMICPMEKTQFEQRFANSKFLRLD